MVSTNTILTRRSTKVATDTARKSPLNSAALQEMCDKHPLESSSSGFSDLPVDEPGEELGVDVVED
jgi:hypothetical protein